MRARASTPRGLYLITPDEPDTRPPGGTGGGGDAAGAAAAIPQQDAPTRRCAASRPALLPLCRAHGVPLIVNDDWRLAADIGAAGAHLGERRRRPRARRAHALGRRRVDRRLLLRRLDWPVARASAGADYVAFGHSSLGDQARRPPRAAGAAGRRRARLACRRWRSAASPRTMHASADRRRRRPARRDQRRVRCRRSRRRRARLRLLFRLTPIDETAHEPASSATTCSPAPSS